jgi:hypothetical protein
MLMRLTALILTGIGGIVPDERASTKALVKVCLRAVVSQTLYHLPLNSIEGERL